MLPFGLSYIASRQQLGPPIIVCTFLQLHPGPEVLVTYRVQRLGCKVVPNSSTSEMGVHTSR